MSERSVLTGYPGSKAAAGVRETIIRQMPPHTIYYEPFAGFAAVARKKRHAAETVLSDDDERVVNILEEHLQPWGPGRLTIWKEDARTILRNTIDDDNPRAVFYLDPPYLLATRTRLLYKVEFETESDHAELLELVKPFKAKVLISGYWSKLYDDLLRGWRCVKYWAMTRGGLREECLWCNFPEPTELHDPRYAGKNFRERERIGRKKVRWAKRLASLPPLERQAIREALGEVDRSSPAAADTAVDDRSDVPAGDNWENVDGPLGNGGVSS